MLMLTCKDFVSFIFPMSVDKGAQRISGTEEIKSENR